LISLTHKTNIKHSHMHTHSYEMQKEREERMSFKSEMVKFQVSKCTYNTWPEQTINH